MWPVGQSLAPVLPGAVPAVVPAAVSRTDQTRSITDCPIVLARHLAGFTPWYRVNFVGETASKGMYVRELKVTVSGIPRFKPARF